MNHEEARAVLRTLELSCSAWPEGRMDTWASILARGAADLPMEHMAQAVERLLEQHDPITISPSRILQQAREIRTDRPRLFGPEPAAPRRIPGIAPWAMIPGCRDPERHKNLPFPLVRTTGHERAAMNTQALKSHQRARERGVITRPQRGGALRDVLVNLFANGLGKRDRVHQRIAGTYCDWCDTSFASVTEITEYLDYIESVHGESGAIGERVFCNGCAYRALRELAPPVGPEDYVTQ